MALFETLKRIYYYKIRRFDFSKYNIHRMRKNGIMVGERCRIFTEITSNEPSLISIGNNVTISSEVRFITHDNAIIKAGTDITDVVGAIRVGDNCFIGMRTIIMLGVSIGDNCIIGAGSVLTKSVPAGYVVAGNPAKIICKTEDYFNKNKVKGIDMKSIQDKQSFFSQHPELIVNKQCLR